MKKSLFFAIVLTCLVAVSPVFAQNNTTPQGNTTTPQGNTTTPQGNVDNGSGQTTVTLDNPLSTDDVPTLIGQIIKAVLGVVGSLALVMFIYGGFTWMLSGGSTERITQGRNILIWAAVGLVVIFTSYALVSFVIESIAK